MANRHERKAAQKQNSPDLFICVPSGHLGMSAFWAFIEQWKGDLPLSSHISNRVDLNRSNCILEQIKRGISNIQNGNPAGSDMLMIDSDVLPQQPLSEVMQYIKESLDAGCDVVIGPLYSPANKWIISPDPVPGTFDVNWASLGFIYIPFKTAVRLTPVSGYGSFNAGGNTPMYFRYTEIASEDTDFINRIKLQGMRVCGNGKIRLAHYKLMPVVAPLEELQLPFKTVGNTGYVDINEKAYLTLDGITQKDRITVQRIILFNGDEMTLLDSEKVFNNLDELKKYIEECRQGLGACQGRI